jgi:curved DNA-binding protein
MAGGQAFVDYYAILQVSRDCDAKTLEAAYRHLAKKYHPDHNDAADIAKFSEVVHAYKVLREPDQRADYDALYSQNLGEDPSSPYRNGGGVDESAALDDADDHARILMFLYNRRREDARNAGVIGYYLQTMLKCSDERFDFHKWYLKEKGFIAITEQGTLAITIQGVDHVISMSRTTRAEKLLLGRSDGPEA